MTDPIDDNDEDAERRAKKKKGGDSGEGDSDSWGRGKAGFGASGGIRIPPQKLKEVMVDWRHLDVTAIVEAVAEFFSEMPMRASANLSVAWEKTKTNVKSFAIVNWVIEFGDRAAHELGKTRELTQNQGKGRAGSGARGLKQKTPKAPGMAGPTGNMGPTGPTGQ